MKNNSRIFSLFPCSLRIVLNFDGMAIISRPYYRGKKARTCARARVGVCVRVCACVGVCGCVWVCCKFQQPQWRAHCILNSGHSLLLSMQVFCVRWQRLHVLGQNVSAWVKEKPEMRVWDASPILRYPAWPCNFVLHVHRVCVRRQNTKHANTRARVYLKSICMWSRAFPDNTGPPSALALFVFVFWVQIGS